METGRSFELGVLNKALYVKNVTLYQLNGLQPV